MEKEYMSKYITQDGRSSQMHREMRPLSFLLTSVVLHQAEEHGLITANISSASSQKDALLSKHNCIKSQVKKKQHWLLALNISKFLKHISILSGLLLCCEEEIIHLTHFSLLYHSGPSPTYIQFYRCQLALNFRGQEGS